MGGTGQKILACSCKRRREERGAATGAAKGEGSCKGGRSCKRGGELQREARSARVGDAVAVQRGITINEIASIAPQYPGNARGFVVW